MKTKVETKGRDEDSDGCITVKTFTQRRGRQAKRGGSEDEGLRRGALETRGDVAEDGVPSLHRA